MTTKEASEMRRAIIEVRNRRNWLANHGLATDEQISLWNESQRLCRVLEDAGEKTYVKGEWE